MTPHREKFLIEMRERAAKLAHWLAILNEPYGELISRREETSSIPGFDDRPRTRPCEHRREWARGGLCLACDNTGWRPCGKNEEGLDPYSAQLMSSTRYVPDETPAMKRHRELERIDAIIGELERNARIREGREPVEDRALRDFRLVQHRPRTVRRILLGLEYLRSLRPLVYARLPHEDALMALALVMYFVAPGRIEDLG